MTAPNNHLPVFLAGVEGLMADHGRDMTLHQIAVLLIICTGGPTTNRGLAERIRTTKPKITRATDRLEADGLVRRSIDPTDRRSIDLVPTNKARNLLTVLASGLSAAARAQEPTS